MQKKKKVNKLHDVEVQAVGLVSVGANEEQFYLLKSQDAEDTIMSDQVVENVAETEEVDDKVVESFATRLFKSLSAKFAATPEAEVVVETPAQEQEVVEKAPEAEVVIEQPEVKAEEVEKSTPPVDDRELLLKANIALAERLEAVEKKLQAEEEKAERLVYVEKAKTFAHLGVDNEALADNLHFVAKADLARYEFWTNLLTAVEARSKDVGLFEEIGKSDAPETKDFETELLDLMKSGDSKAISEKLASLNREQAESYLDSRHAAIRK